MTFERFFDRMQMDNMEERLAYIKRIKEIKKSVEELTRIEEEKLNAEL